MLFVLAFCNWSPGCHCRDPILYKSQCTFADTLSWLASISTIDFHRFVEFHIKASSKTISQVKTMEGQLVISSGIFSGKSSAVSVIRQKTEFVDFCEKMLARFCNVQFRFHLSLFVVVKFNQFQNCPQRRNNSFVVIPFEKISRRLHIFFDASIFQHQLVVYFQS